MSEERDPELEALLARYIEQETEDGQRLDLTLLCADRPHLLAPLLALVERYQRLSLALGADTVANRAPDNGPLPCFSGFRTLERLGRGGTGEVFKLEDLTLGRIVAAKVLRPDSSLAASVADFLREARSLALFEDPRVVRLLEYRPADPPVLLMEYVDGFAIDEIGPSLEYAQRARIIAEVANALHHAHQLGLQHRDLKPSHILLDARLQPKILDFGLARGEADRGHGVGTLPCMAPEQLDPAQPIDARTDVYALGVILYQLLAGSLPYGADTDQALVAAILAGEPRLPIEIQPSVPEPLQAVTLKAMARDPSHRYRSAREMALDLERFLQGRPVQARPVSYRSALERRLRPHLEQIGDWERLRLLYPHEGDRLRDAYRRLKAREDDWIVESRVLSFSQIALYLGAFLLACGSLLYFGAYLENAVRGLLRPALALAVPFLGLSAVAHWLHRREHQAAALAFHLGAAALLPLALIILFREAGLLMGGAGGPGELFEKVTNRQLQVSLSLACAWLASLAARTRTVALSSGFAVALLATHLAWLGDFGLDRWLEDGRWDLVGTALLPLLFSVAVLGRGCEWRGWPWFAVPLYFGGAALGVVILELLALDGRALAHLGITLRPLQEAEVRSPLLLDTVVAMTLNGFVVYALGVALERRGTPLMRAPAQLLYAVSPFAILEPLAYLNEVGEYSRRFDWMYLSLALAMAFLSRFRQRRSFYYAGVLNAGLALWLITDHYQWQNRPAWAVAVLLSGALALAVGFLLGWFERRRRVQERRDPC